MARKPFNAKKHLAYLKGSAAAETLGVAVLRKGSDRITGKPTYTFSLIARNNERLIRGSHPYNTKQAAVKTLRKYFSRFEIVDTTIK